MKKVAQGIELTLLSNSSSESLAHAHCSTIVTFPDSEILAGWYWATEEANINEEIFFSRKKLGKTWSKPEPWGLKSPIMFDGNPVLWIAPDTGLLHIFYNAGWGWSFVFAKHKVSEDKGVTWVPQPNVYPFISRGLKNPPIMLSNGDYLLPAYVEFKYLRGVFFLSKNRGKKWKQSNFVDLKPSIIPDGYESKKGRQVEQPTVIQRQDGSLLALFRNDGRPMKWMLKSESFDGGKTWSPASNYILPNPAGGFHMIKAKSGNIIIIYNHAPSAIDNDMKWRNPLSVALSEDDGETWAYRRNLIEWHPGDEGDNSKETFEYPTITQAADGTFHATWSLSHEVERNGEKNKVMDIQYTYFTEDWIKQKSYFDQSWEL